ncbi:MAG: hypothetical protein KKB91_01550 [Proteobacteria bacterium]|nr:hypothetical protein [Pseudomonadota bacterium]MBU4326414.1 hypothetical protein [Pseudomonadota bacterium]
MMSSENKEICDGCGRSALLQDMQGNEFCDSCGQIAQVIKTDPQLLRKICTLIRSDLHGSENGGQACLANPSMELPEVLDAVRYRTRDRELNTWYVSISELKGNPVEIFASTAFDRDHHLQSRISNLTTITRLVSLVLRHVFLGEVLTLEKTIKQLHRSSRQKNDLPDMLTRVLSRYIKNPKKIVEDLEEKGPSI